jgi:hypothetical protein
MNLRMRRRRPFAPPMVGAWFIAFGASHAEAQRYSWEPSTWTSARLAASTDEAELLFTAVTENGRGTLLTVTHWRVRGRWATEIVRCVDHSDAQMTKSVIVSQCYVPLAGAPQ